LKLVDHSTATSLDGNFAFGDGHENYLYTFYKDGTLKKWESSCMGDYPITKGRYKFLKNFKIKLSGQGEFYIYKLDKFLFLVPTLKDKTFRSDFAIRAKEVSELPASKSTYEWHTDQFFIAFGLAKNYYTRLD
jgi:hypothetical protein